QDHEEVYVLVEGAGTLTVEGEDIVLDPGDAVRVAPTASRVLTFHESSTMVAVGAP
ncbi:MAG: mannose-6-phosphate isomerase-like protein (cupin superfamily), partial [Halovenus sp.]